MAGRYILRHRMFRLGADDRARLRDLSLLWDVPQGVIVRVALDDALSEFQDSRRKPRDAFLDQPRGSRYSEHEKKISVNTYITDDQNALLELHASKWQIPCTNIVRVGLQDALDELERLDPERHTLPKRYQEHIRAESYSGFATQKKVDPSFQVENITFALTKADAFRLQKLFARFKVPYRTIVRVGLQYAMEELENLASEHDAALPRAYWDAPFRGTRFRQLKRPSGEMPPKRRARKSTER